MLRLLGGEAVLAGCWLMHTDVWGEVGDGDSVQLSLCHLLVDVGWGAVAAVALLVLGALLPSSFSPSPPPSSSLSVGGWLVVGLSGDFLGRLILAAPKSLSPGSLAWTSCCWGCWTFYKS